MSTQVNVQTVQKIYEAFGRQDIPFILEALADNIEWNEPPGGEAPFKGTYQGREEVSRFFQQLAEAVEVQTFEPREFVALGDTVVALGFYQFRARKTGRTYETKWAMVWQFGSDEKIIKFDIHKDSAAESAALREE